MNALSPAPFLYRKHIEYFSLLFQRVPTEFESIHSQRLLVLYFCATSADILRVPWCASVEQRLYILDELSLCYDKETGGFCPTVFNKLFSCNRDLPTLTMTHCAVHVLFLSKLLSTALDSWLSLPLIRQFILRCFIDGVHRQGRCAEDMGGFSSHPSSTEIDVRFSYSALVTLYFLFQCEETKHHCLPPRPRGSFLTFLQETCAIAPQRIFSYILCNWNSHDGGFGGGTFNESHGGMTFCGIASLSLLGVLQDPILWDKFVASRGLQPSLNAFVSKVMQFAVRRLNSGSWDEMDCEQEDDHDVQCQLLDVGFQGRSGKSCDTCYTFWLGGTISILSRIISTSHAEEGAEENWIPCSVLRFVLSCQHPKYGGISKHQGEFPDPMHSALGLSGIFSSLHFVRVLRAQMDLEGTVTDEDLVVLPEFGVTISTARSTGLI